MNSMTESSGRLKGKVAVITGGASGIGAAFVRRFVAEGANVVIADLDEATGAALVEELGAATAFRTTNVTNEAQFAGAIEEAVSRWGRLDSLVNNAAVLVPPSPLQETSDEQFDLLLNVNVRGVWLGCKLAYPHLKRSKGNVVNIASMAGVTGQADHAVYGATKGAVNALTRCAAVDWGPEGIRVNSICPCGVMTDKVRGWIQSMPDPAEGENAMRHVHALNRWSEPSEIAAAAAFLASDDASFVTGCLMSVAGGSDCGYKA
jgi:meso-butanediol dehydrogenase/(S,S)-butanediol dehydrogenase/diacetyl reductase